jgi:hypothetical protein
MLKNRIITVSIELFKNVTTFSTAGKICVKYCQRMYVIQPLEHIFYPRNWLHIHNWDKKTHYRNNIWT